MNHGLYPGELSSDDALHSQLTCAALGDCVAREIGPAELDARRHPA
jgi:hypothetical protein